jgi:murein L,D-transpeptidase YafK
MKIYLGLMFILVSFAFIADDFKTQQLKNSRVKEAYKSKEELVKQLLKAKNTNISNCEIYLRAFKKEEVLELWAKNKNDVEFKLIKEYKFCSSSGSLGPKRKQGDYQTPEGFYHIDRFNPWSNFYLSLGLNYPNQSDRALGNKAALGGDIFIHGSCVTVGCIPLTDDKIKEIYVFAVEARNNGQKEIPVHIFPAKMDSKNYSQLKSGYSNNVAMLNFWENLKPVYDAFEEKKLLPKVIVKPDGSYEVKN